MKRRTILFYVLLFSNTINFVESTCDYQEIKSSAGNKICRTYYECYMEYPIIKKIVTCSNVSLSNIISNANIPEDATFSVTLNVVHSDIPVLPTSVFKNTNKLYVLHLKNSNLQKIIPGAFNFLDDLQELYLDGNQLTTISDGIFNSLTLLEKLELSRNQIEVISDHAFEGVKLKELRINQNNISQLGQVLMDSLTSLETLDISWNNLNNITSFNNLPINSLNLSHNSVNMVDFESLPEHLTKIDLSFNHITEIISFNESEAHEVILNHNNLRNLDVNVKTIYLDVSYNEIETIGSDLFGGSLLTFNAGNNLISSIRPNAFLGLNKLEQLLLNSNNLSFIPNSCFKDLHSLIYLDLSRNKLSHFAFGTFENMLNLKVLNISYNNLKDLQQYKFYPLVKVTDLLFQNNKISEVHVDDLMIHMPDLKTVNLDSNDWSCKRLLEIIHSFKKKAVSFSSGNSLVESNINGIKCYEPSKTSTVDTTSNSDTDVSNSNLNTFLNEGFKETVMFRYFNKEFKDSNFFKYLESLRNNTSSGNQNLNISVFKKLIEELKLNCSHTYTGKFNDSKLEELILSFKDLVENNSKVNNNRNSLKYDFSQSDMHKYFNTDFKNSDLFKYLESLRRRTVQEQYSENVTKSEMEKFVSSSEVKKTVDYSHNYRGLLLFISVMLVAITCVMILMTISNYLFISHIKKCNAPRKDEIQLV